MTSPERETPASRFVTTGLSIEPEQLRRLTQLAEENDRSVSAEIRVLVRRYLAQESTG